MLFLRLSYLLSLCFIVLLSGCSDDDAKENQSMSQESAPVPPDVSDPKPVPPDGSDPKPVPPVGGDPEPVPPVGGDPDPVLDDKSKARIRQWNDIYQNIQSEQKQDALAQIDTQIKNMPEPINQFERKAQKKVLLALEDKKKGFKSIEQFRLRMDSAKTIGEMKIVYFEIQSSMIFKKVNLILARQEILDIYNKKVAPYNKLKDIRFAISVTYSLTKLEELQNKLDIFDTMKNPELQQIKSELYQEITQRGTILSQALVDKYIDSFDKAKLKFAEFENDIQKYVQTSEKMRETLIREGRNYKNEPKKDTYHLYQQLDTFYSAHKFNKRKSGEPILKPGIQGIIEQHLLKDNIPYFKSITTKIDAEIARYDPKYTQPLKSMKSQIQNYMVKEMAKNKDRIKTLETNDELQLRYLKIARGQIHFMLISDRNDVLPENIKWTESAEREVEQTKRLTRIDLTQSFDALRELLKKVLDVDQNLKAPILRIQKKAMTNTDLKQKWDNLKYVNVHKLTPNIAYKLEPDEYMIVRVLASPGYSLNSKKEIRGFETLKLMNIRDNQNYLTEYMTSRYTYKSGFVASINYLREQSNGGHVTFIGYFFSATSSSSLIRGGQDFEPYYSTDWLSKTWKEAPRAGLMLTARANNILAADKNDLSSPYTRTLLRTDYPRKWGQVQNYVLDKTPEEVTNKKPTDEAPWNELYLIPVTQNRDGSHSSTEITAIFAYTPEPDSTKWPESFKALKELAKINKLPMIIIWNVINQADIDKL